METIVTESYQKVVFRMNQMIPGPVPINVQTGKAS